MVHEIHGKSEETLDVIEDHLGYLEDYPEDASCGQTLSWVMDRYDLSIGEAEDLVQSLFAEKMGKEKIPRFQERAEVEDGEWTEFEQSFRDEYDGRHSWCELSSSVGEGQELRPVKSRGQLYVEKDAGKVIYSIDATMVDPDARE